MKRLRIKSRICAIGMILLFTGLCAWSACSWPCYYNCPDEGPNAQGICRKGWGSRYDCQTTPIGADSCETIDTEDICQVSYWCDTEEVIGITRYESVPIVTGECAQG